MAFNSNYQPKSTCREARNIIREEINSYYGHGREKEYGAKTALDAMQKDANACSAGRGTSDWNKGKELVNAGCFACYYEDQRLMLNKIYGKQTVDKWRNEKVHETYGSLIGREYNAMLRERERKNKN